MARDRGGADLEKLLADRGRQLMGGLPPGSYLALSDGANTSEAREQAHQRYTQTGAVPYRLRSPIDERNERDERVRARLLATLRRAFPAAAAARVTHHWGGPLAAPRDWSMSVRFDRASGLGVAGGYTGHGVVASNISGATLADLVLGRESALAAMPWVGHRSRRWEPEPLRFLASRAIVGTLGAADRREDSSGRPARRVALLRPFLPPGH